MTLKAEDGYTIYGVTAGNQQVTWEKDGKTVYVNVPAGSEDVILDVDVRADQYTYTVPQNDAFTVSVEGNPDKLTVGVTYKVTVTAKNYGDTYNDYVLNANGAAVSNEKTANGSILTSKQLADKGAAQAAILNGITVYRGPQCGTAYKDLDDLDTGNNYFIKTSDNVRASVTVEFTVAYNADGNIDFTVVK